MEKRILFFTPFIEEHRFEGEKSPAHDITQRIVNKLRNNGLRVITTSCEDTFLYRFSSFELIIVFNFDGRWMVETVDKASPTVKVLYYYCVCEPESPLITPCFIGNELMDINMDSMLETVLGSLVK